MTAPNSFASGIVYLSAWMDAREKSSGTRMVLMLALFFAIGLLHCRELEPYSRLIAARWLLGFRLLCNHRLHGQGVDSDMGELLKHALLKNQAFLGSYWGAPFCLCA